MCWRTATTATTAAARGQAAYTIHDPLMVAGPAGRYCRESRADLSGAVLADDREGADAAGGEYEDHAGADGEGVIIAINISAAVADDNNWPTYNGGIRAVFVPIWAMRESGRDVFAARALSGGEAHGVAVASGGAVGGPYGPTRQSDSLAKVRAGEVSAWRERPCAHRGVEYLSSYPGAVARPVWEHGAAESAGVVQLRLSGESSMSRRIVVSVAAGAVVLAGAGAFALAYAGDQPPALAHSTARYTAPVGNRDGSLTVTTDVTASSGVKSVRVLAWPAKSSLAKKGPTAKEMTSAESAVCKPSGADTARCTYKVTVSRADADGSPRGLWHVAVLATAKDDETTLETKAADFTG